MSENLDYEYEDLDTDPDLFDSFIVEQIDEETRKLIENF